MGLIPYLSDDLIEWFLFQIDLAKIKSWTITSRSPTDPVQCVSTDRGKESRAVGQQAARLHTNQS